MVEIPLPVLVAQWVILIVLGVLVVLIYRELAYVIGMETSRDHSADGPAVGSEAPSFEYRAGLHGERREFVPSGKRSVLLFTDPGCGACTTAVALLERAAAAGETARLRVLVVTDGEIRAVAANDQLRETSLELALVAHKVAHHEYHVTATPMLICVDADARIHSKRAGVSQETLSAFLDAARGGLLVSDTGAQSRDAHSREEMHHV